MRTLGGAYVKANDVQPSSRPQSVPNEAAESAR